jgi:hypothetical protein
MSPPPQPEKPPGGGARPRQPSQPKLQGAIAGDEQPERGAVNHPGVDGVAQPAPRKATLTGLGAQRPSGEYAPTLPAPPDPPLKKTWRLPTPPSAVALARRTDPPQADDTLPAPGEPGGQPEASSGPTSLELQVAALRARAEAAEAAKAELERQARVRSESQGPGPYQAPVVVAPERPSKAPESSAASDGSTKALRSAVTKLVLGLAALLALLGIPLTAYIQALTTQIERSNSQATQARTEAADAKAGNSKAKQEAAATKAELAQFKAYFREVMRLQGVEIAKQKDDPDAGDLKPVTPLCQAGKVCSGPQLIVTVAP